MRKRIGCLGVALFLAGMFLAEPGFGAEKILGSKTIGDYKVIIGEWNWVSVQYKGVEIWMSGRAGLTKKDWSADLWDARNIPTSVFKQNEDKTSFSWKANNEDLGFSSDWQINCLPEKIKMEANYTFEKDIDAFFCFWPTVFNYKPDLVEGCKVDVLSDTGRVHSTTFPVEYSKFKVEFKAVKLYTKIGNITIKKESPFPVSLNTRQQSEKKYDIICGFKMFPPAAGC